MIFMICIFRILYFMNAFIATINKSEFFLSFNVASTTLSGGLRGYRGENKWGVWTWKLWRKLDNEAQLNLRKILVESRSLGQGGDRGGGGGRRRIEEGEGERWIKEGGGEERRRRNRLESQKWRWEERKRMKRKRVKIISEVWGGKWGGGGCLQKVMREGVNNEKEHQARSILRTFVLSFIYPSSSCPPPFFPGHTPSLEVTTEIFVVVYVFTRRSQYCFQASTQLSVVVWLSKYAAGGRELCDGASGSLTSTHFICSS